MCSCFTVIFVVKKEQNLRLSLFVEEALTFQTMQEKTKKNTFFWCSRLVSFLLKRTLKGSMAKKKTEL